jgi:precorrin-6B methylase 2
MSIANKNKNFKTIILNNKVFKPTGTTEILINSSIDILNNLKNKKILDLGCGSGVVGISVSKNIPKKNFFYFSDLSKHATNLTKKNLIKHNLYYEVKTGSLFSPWKNYKFDYILNDVAGISEIVAKISPWYNRYIPSDCGVDGTKNISKILSHANNFLTKKGCLIFPIISLSNKNKILNLAKKNFDIVKKISAKSWPLPKSMYKHKKKLLLLKKKKLVSFKEIYGLILFDTEVYIAKKINLY